VTSGQTGLVARALRAPRVRLGLAAVLLLYAIALLAPLLAPYDPTLQLDLVHGSLLGPSLAHPLGTDPYSRDLLSRLLYGARLSLWIAGLAVLVAITLGTAVGLTAGLLGGITDAILMRLVDAGLAIPRFFLLLVVLSLWRQGGITALVLVLGLTGWFGTSRLVRAEVLSIKHRDFVVAARALGIPALRIALVHVLPNVLAPVIVTATLGVGNTVLVEAGLSFLGLGVRQPVAAWGNMILDGRPYLSTHPWQIVVPGAAVVVTVVVWSLLGDGLREALDPRATS
jgi:peptide/nickel transport system permease protein